MLTHSKHSFQKDLHFSYNFSQPFRIQMVTAGRLFFNDLTFGINADISKGNYFQSRQRLGYVSPTFFSHWSIFKTYHGWRWTFRGPGPVCRYDSCRNSSFVEETCAQKSKSIKIHWIRILMRGGVVLGLSSQLFGIWSSLFSTTWGSECQKQKENFS